MKNLYFIYFCSNLLLLFQVTNGGLAKDFLGTIHGTAHKVKDGIVNVFAPNENTNNKETYPAINNVNVDETEYEPAFIFAASTATPKVKPNIDPQVKPTQENHDSEELPLVFATSSTTEASTKSNTTDDKDGRENFAGGCLPGKKRTSDGRCVDKF